MRHKMCARQTISPCVVLALVAMGTAFVSTCDAQANMSVLLASYKNFDYPPADGNSEITSLTPVEGIEFNPAATPRNVPLTLVFVEPRLLETIPGSGHASAT